ncbi:MAG: VOC family protein [Spirulinaceae cyanobacterium]
MAFRYTYTRLNVSDYQACKAFYHDVMGWEVIYSDDQEEYAEFATGQTKITIFNRQKLKEFLGNDETTTYDPHYAGVALTFEVNNLDETIKQLKAQGVKLINNPWNYPDRGFISACFRDPDGNLIELQQSIFQQPTA